MANVSYAGTLTLSGCLIESSVPSIDASSTFWLKNGQKIQTNTVPPVVQTIGNRFVLRAEGLVIEDMTFEMEGRYQCGILLAGRMTEPALSQDIQVYVEGNIFFFK